MIRRALHRMAQWWRRIRWYFHASESARHLRCSDMHRRKADEVWLGKGKSRRQQRTGETHS